MPDRVCEVCGAVFWSKRLAKTCSEECFKKRKARLNAEYVEQNREQVREYHKAYYQEVTKPVQKQLYALHKKALKARYEQHKDERNERRRAIYAGNKEAVQKKNAEWREKNREIKRAIDREYYAKHKEERVRQQREYYAKRKDEIQRKRRFAVLEQTKVTVDGTTLTLFYCEKLKLKASRLPCGDRWQCWDGEPCQFIPKGKEPMSFQTSVVSPPFNPYNI